jgi:hypothetical protein
LVVLAFGKHGFIAVDEPHLAIQNHEFKIAIESSSRSHLRRSRTNLE